MRRYSLLVNRSCFPDRTENIYISRSILLIALQEHWQNEYCITSFRFYSSASQPFIHWNQDIPTRKKKTQKGLFCLSFIPIEAMIVPFIIRGYFFFFHSHTIPLCLFFCSPHTRKVHQIMTNGFVFFPSSRSRSSPHLECAFKLFPSYFAILQN